MASTSLQQTAPGYGKIIALAIPIIIANSATPLLGLADTAIIGNVAGTEQLGAVALGALLFNFIYWGFGFLRMSTTGFVAQAAGRSDATATGNSGEILEITLRALSLGVMIGCGLLLLQWPLLHLSLIVLGASTEVENITAGYFRIRIWGAPAILSLYVLMGYMIGQGLSRMLMGVQLFLNGSNILLDLLLAGFLEMGASGIAAGTAMAEWMTLVLALFLVFRHLNSMHSGVLKTVLWKRLWQQEALSRTLSANTNLMIRTLFLLLSFAIFADQGARFSDTTLAANHILLQFISFSAFFLDGFAFVSESLVGRAIGRHNLKGFDLAVKRSSLLAAATAILLACVFMVGGNTLIQWLTNLAEVRTTASQFLPYATLYILLSFAAFQLDGIFIGATDTKALRNASVLATLGFIGLSTLLIPTLQNSGLWIAFIGFVVLRALALLCYFPRLRDQLTAPTHID